MADPHALLVEAFQQRLAGSPLLERVDEREALQLGREAAEAVLGPLMWRELLGEDRLDTTRVALLLGISRQAVHKRVKSGAMLGVPGRGTTWFPAWQFDRHRATVREVVPALLRAWAEAGGLDEVDALAVLSWSRTPQSELADDSPEDWIALGKPDGPVLRAARQASRALAS